MLMAVRAATLAHRTVLDQRRISALHLDLAFVKGYQPTFARHLAALPRGVAWLLISRASCTRLWVRQKRGVSSPQLPLTAPTKKLAQSVRSEFVMRHVSGRIGRLTFVLK
jgi:hypothetical protein